MGRKKGCIPWNKNKRGIYSEESLKKMRDNTPIRTGSLNPFYNHKHTEETKKKQSVAKLKENLSEETRRKKSESASLRTGPLNAFYNHHHTKEKIRKQSEFAKTRIGPLNGFYGKKHTEETKKIQGIIHSKENLSEDTLRKRKEARAKQIFPLKDTVPETTIQNFLKELNIEFLTHQHMKIKHAYQADILVPSMNLVIECYGDFFHCRPDKYNAEYKCFKDSMTAEERWKQDAAIEQELIEKGFRVIVLWEHEIKKMSLNDFKNVLGADAPTNRAPSAKQKPDGFCALRKSSDFRSAHLEVKYV